MNFHKPLTVVMAAFLLASCASNPHFYSGDPRPISEVARVAPMGYIRDANVKIQKVDGKSWDASDWAHVLPGEHTFELNVQLDGRYEGGHLHFKQAVFTVSARLEAGDRYLPEAEVINGKAFGRIVRLDKDFPEQCMPGPIALNRSKAAFASLHKDERHCDRPIPSIHNVR